MITEMTRPILVTSLVLMLVVAAACGCAPPPTPAPTEPMPEPTTVAGGIDSDALANLEYKSGWTEAGTAPLTDGEYREQAAPGSATETVVRLTEHVAFGQLDDGQEMAAVILVTDPGGSGTFYDLALVVERDGQPVHVLTTLLGDRAQINSLTIENDEMVVDMITHGPEDPMCCPTLHVVQTFAPGLVQTSSQVIEPEVTAPDIVGVTWQWAELTETAPAAQSVVPDPQNYTLMLKPDGEVSIKADCNMVGGTYTLEGASLTIALGPATMAYCGDDSLDQLYLAMLGNVGSASLENGRLVLHLKDNAGQIVFDKGGPAEAPSPETPAPDIVGVTWQWAQLTETAPAAQSVVPDPQNYTLMLKPDGEVSIKADCNMVGGTYTLEGASLTIALGPATMAYCGDDSLDQLYLAMLGNVGSASLENGRLVLHLKDNAGQMVLDKGGPAEAPSPEAPAPDIVGVTWQWAQLTETAPAAQSVVPDPQNYTLMLKPDGEVSIKADCNMVGGTYTLEGASLTIALGPSTLAYCGGDSLDQLYLAMLGNVGSFDVENGRLALNLKEGAGKMVFDNGGSAEAVAPDVVGTLWKWEAFKDQSGQNDVTVDNPDNYTLMLKPDGEVSIKADCKGVGGTYTLEGASLTIALGPSIMVYCGDDSLEQQYLALLGDVVTSVMHEGNLVLNLKMDAGDMIFTQG